MFRYGVTLFNTMKKRSVFLLTICAVLLLMASCFESENNGSAKKIPEADSSRSYMYIASEGLNVRQNPDASSSIVTVLYQNDKILTDKVSHGGWYKISTADGSAEGYVNASYLSATPVDEAKAAATATAQQKQSVPAAETQPATRSKVIPEEKDSSAETTVTTTAAPESAEPMHPTLTKRPKN